MNATRYTLDDCGCYVDGAKGIYATDDIVAFARAHGAEIEHDEDDCEGHGDTCFPSEFGGCEWASEIEDEATDYMNDHYAVDGAYWGRSEAGDWGLWACDE